MTENEYKKFCKRYEQFKECNLPELFFDDERQTAEYVYFCPNKMLDCKDPLKRNLEVHTNLVSALENIAYTGFYYSFTSKNIYRKKENGKIVTKIEVGHDHAHSFEEVVISLYDFPESFSISKDEEQFFSKQELDYLRRVQKYLLFIGMKDLNNYKRKKSRYKNRKQNRYEDARILTFSKANLELALTGEKLFRVYKYIEDFSKERIYEPKENRTLIVDEEDNFKMFIEFTSTEIKKYKDIKPICKDNRFNDDDKVEICNFKILEKY